ncbi:hypothetical protein H5410_060361 [Solanum commersonii]|uniref:Uncharacterized protein n=1 Tax=Solanum commersonii TaxID=4109 RepID=A0A9J5W4V9_SOLCO|nr:hypothetical protein H5410_060361 [Solanum commersonii]
MLVLFSLHNFWGAVFILPQGVVNEVDRKCREFLWGGTEEKRKVSFVAWDIICRPKKQGGLNIKGCKLWNMIALGKLIWQLMEKSDILWVKWVNELYMNNNETFWSHVPSPNSCWYWRQLHKLKIKRAHWYRDKHYCLTKNKNYSISRGYLDLLGPTLEDWLEDATHILLDFLWTQGVWEAVKTWTGIDLSNKHVSVALLKIKMKHWNRFKNETMTAIYGAIVYNIWIARNQKIF